MAKGDHKLHYYLIILIVLATLVFSVLSYVNTLQLKKFIIPKTIDSGNFFGKLTAHEELEKYADVQPLNLIQVNANNLPTLQSQIEGLDASFIGSFIVQYADSIVLYDYENDEIKGILGLQQAPQIQLPQDFFVTLNKHIELRGLRDQEPVVGRLDADSLTALQQQFPNEYQGANAGDYLLRYGSKLIIFNYERDKIVNSIDLQ